MIKVVAKNFVRTEKINEYLEYAKQMVEETVKEQGCIKYELFQDEKEPKTLTFIEEWEDKAALILHTQSAHFVKFIPLMGKLQESDSELTIYNKVI